MPTMGKRRLSFRDGVSFGEELSGLLPLLCGCGCFFIRIDISANHSDVKEYLYFDEGSFMKVWSFRCTYGRGGAAMEETTRSQVTRSLKIAVALLLIAIV